MGTQPWRIRAPAGLFKALNGAQGTAHGGEHIIMAIFHAMLAANRRGLSRGGLDHGCP